MKQGTLVIATGMLLLQACGASVDSTDLNTNGIYARISVYSEGSGLTTVGVDLRTGSHWDSDEVKLTGGETLTATALGETKKLKRNLFPEYDYGAMFAFDTGATEFVVSLNRKEFESAPNSHVVLPLASVVTAPTSGSEFGSTDIFDMAWDNTLGIDKSVSLSVSLECTAYNEDKSTTKRTAYFSESVPDTGSYPGIKIEDLLAKIQNIDTSKQCVGKASISRYSTGELDSHYGKGGSVSASQTRIVRFIVNP